MQETGPSQRDGVAAQLRAGTRAYAAAAAERLIEHEEDGAAGYDTFRTWQGFLTQRVIELAVAVEVDEPALFAGEVHWSYAAFDAHRMDRSMLADAIEHLAEALRHEMSSPSFELVRPALERAGEVRPEDRVERDELCAGDPEHALALRFLEAALTAEPRRAIALVLEALQAGAAVATLFERVLMPAQAEMGRLWHAGQIGVAEEHAATETVRTAMGVLWHAAPPSTSTGRTVVVGAVSDDRHDIGVRATAHLLELAGHRSVNLGGDVPVEEFPQAARDHGACAAVVSATMGVHLPRARETVRAIRAHAEGVRVLVGGPAFTLAPDLWKKVGADAHAASPSDAARLLSQG